MTQASMDMETRPLPAGWKWVKLGDVADFLDSMRKPINETERQKRIQNKGDSQLYPYYGANGPVGAIDDYIFDFPAILLAEDGGHFGSEQKPIAYKVQGKYWVNNHAHILRPKDGVDFEYIYRSIMIRPDIISLTAGSTRAKLNQATAKLIDIPLPPLEEQQRISSILNEQMASVEQARKAAEERLEAAQALPAAYLREVFPSSENELPAGWKWVKLGDVCDVNPKRPSLDWADGTKTTFVPMPSVDDKTGAITEPEEKDYSEISKGYTYFQENDVLFAKITPCMQNGKHAIASNLLNGFAFGSTEFHVLRPQEQIISEWIHKFLRQPSILNEAKLHFRGAVGQQRVPKEFLSELPIPLPPLAEQQRISSILNEQMASVEQVSSSIQEELDSIDAMPSALLRKAFNGEL